jgi:ABC-type sugar transport system permease subunit
MEPGDAPWERFGHDAIIILDHASGQSWAYNYGIFDFDAPNFIGNFVRGRMEYWMDVDPGGPTVEMYARANRSVWLDELNLSPAQRLKLFAMLEENRKPQNKFYRYDYFRDNCTTRVRDALDRTVDGEISRQLKDLLAGATYRWHTRIGMADYPLLYTGLELAMGPLCDRKLSAWEECFLPATLMDQLKRVTIDDGSGARIPLIKQSMRVYTSTRPPLPAHPPGWWWIFLLIGLAIGGMMVGLAQFGWRKTFLTVAFVWSLVASLAALFQLFLWCCTDHAAGYRNENLLQFSPFSWVVLVAGLRGFRWRFARQIILIPLGLAILGVLLKPLPWFIEWNWEMIALALPAHAGLAIAAFLLKNPMDPERQSNPRIAVAN